MGLNSQILTIKDPTIKLDEIQTLDLGENETGAPVDSMNAAYQPFIKINGYVFDQCPIDGCNARLGSSSLKFEPTFQVGVGRPRICSTIPSPNGESLVGLHPSVAL